jgi:DNA repair exonuclease SbcCD ATPase subunit
VGLPINAAARYLKEGGSEMFNRKLVSQFSLGLFLLSLAFATSTVYGAQTSKDSKEVSAILADVKTEAIQLRHDADELKAFTRSTLTWQTHAEKVEEIKRHVNNAGQSLSKLDSARGSASPWQQQAIDRINPLLKEIASNVESTIEHFNRKPKLLQTGPYVDYAAANYELASNLAELISDYVEYGKSKAKSEELAAKLEAPGN